MPATVTLDFDPNLKLFGATIRAETLGVAAAILIMLVLAALAAGRVRDRGDGRRPMRRDDLLYVAFGTIPGAIVGGRLGYCLIHLDYYRANPNAIADPTQGGAALTLALVGGTLGAIAVARLLDAPIGRWLQVAAIPLLVGLGLGKLAMALGGDGQGKFGEGAFSSRYVHAGTWMGGNPDRAAVASQAIEGALVLAVVAVLVVLPVLLRFRVRRWWRVVRPGWSDSQDWWLLTGPRRFLVAVAAWACVRFAAASTWRDATVYSGLRAEQLVLLALIGVCLLGLVAGAALRARSPRRAVAAEAPSPQAAGRAG